jgi:hypothetical protein
MIVYNNACEFTCVQMHVHSMCTRTRTYTTDYFVLYVVVTASEILLPPTTSICLITDVSGHTLASKYICIRTGYSGQRK